MRRAGVQGRSLVRVLRALGLVESLDQLVAEPTPSPIDLLGSAGRSAGARRARAGAGKRRPPPRSRGAGGMKRGEHGRGGTALGDPDRGRVIAEGERSRPSSTRRNSRELDRGVAPGDAAAPRSIHVPGRRAETFHGLPGSSRTASRTATARR